MNDERKTKAQLMAELAEARQRVNQSETAETARQQAEDALRQSEELFRVVLTITLDPVFVTDRDGQFTFICPNVPAILGYSLEDIQALGSISNLVGGDLPDQAELEARGEITNIETVIVDRHGRQRIFLMTAKRVSIGRGTLLYAFHDITQRKQAEKALRESEARYRAVAHSATDAIISADSAGNIVGWNPGAERMFGYTEVEASGQPLTILQPSRYYARPLAGMARVQAGGEQHLIGKMIEVEGQHKDGHEFLLELSLAEWQVADGRFYTAIMRDITERKRAEAALRESQSLYHSLVEVLPLNICRKDLAGRFTFANRRFLEASNRSLADLVGKTDFDLHPPELAEKYRRDDQAVMDSGQAQELIEARAVLGGGPIVVQTIKVPLYDGAGKINGVQISFWDITARQQAADVLRELNATLEQRVADRTAELQAANTQLTELDRLKDEFISRISHELRTPLVNIKLYLGLLDHGKPEKHAEYMDTLRREAARLQQLIEDLLRISQLAPESGGIQLTPIDVNQLLAQLVIDRASLARERGLQLKSQPAPELPRAAADATLLLQALSNLMTNAINYTPAGGTLTLSTALRAGDDQTWVTCTIHDTGPGISAKDRLHIFERFYRGEAAKDYTLPGAGLGLSICWEIINKLGGRITLESEPGHGAAFTVWLKPAD